MRRPLFMPIALAANLQCLQSAPAQNWPTRTVTMVAPFAAGGPLDLTARILVPLGDES